MANPRAQKIDIQEDCRWGGPVAWSGAGSSPKSSPVAALPLQQKARHLLSLAPSVKLGTECHSNYLRALWETKWKTTENKTQ